MILNEMNKISKILDRIQNGNFEEGMISEILELDQTNLNELLIITRKLTDKEFGKTLKSYIPGNRFPAISITGSQCFLNCKHCNKHYLELMINADTPDKLIKICKKLDKEGAIGCLISGGFDNTFALPFEPFLSALKFIKKNTNLVLNIHTGLISEKLALALGDVGVDIVSFDVVGDSKTIKAVYGIDKKPSDYINSINALKSASIKHIAPHICIGLHFGNISGEIEALKMIKEFNPYLIVLLALVPTKNTAIEGIKLEQNLVVKIITLTRLMFPTTPISLGCMRPGGRFRQNLDILAFRAGINRIEIPSNPLVKYLKNNRYKLLTFNSCCALPSELESELEIKEKINILNKPSL